MLVYRNLQIYEYVVMLCMAIAITPALVSEDKSLMEKLLSGGHIMHKASSSLTNSFESSEWNIAKRYSKMPWDTYQ